MLVQAKSRNAAVGTETDHSPLNSTRVVDRSIQSCCVFFSRSTLLCVGVVGEKTRGMKERESCREERGCGNKTSVGRQTSRFGASRKADIVEKLNQHLYLYLYHDRREGD